MKAIPLTLPKKNTAAFLRYAATPQWKPWKQTQPEKSSFVIEDFIADLFSRLQSRPRRHQGK